MDSICLFRTEKTTQSGHPMSFNGILTLARWAGGKDQSELYVPNKFPRIA